MYFCWWGVFFMGIIQMNHAFRPICIFYMESLVYLNSMSYLIINDLLSSFTKVLIVCFDFLCMTIRFLAFTFFHCTIPISMCSTSLCIICKAGKVVTDSFNFYVFWKVKIISPSIIGEHFSGFTRFFFNWRFFKSNVASISYTFWDLCVFTFEGLSAVCRGKNLLWSCLSGVPCASCS